MGILEDLVGKKTRILRRLDAVADRVVSETGGSRPLRALFARDREDGDPGEGEPETPLINAVLRDRGSSARPAPAPAAGPVFPVKLADDVLLENAIPSADGAAITVQVSNPSKNTRAAFVVPASMDDVSLLSEARRRLTPPSKVKST